MHVKAPALPAYLWAGPLGGGQRRTARRGRAAESTGRAREQIAVQTGDRVRPCTQASLVMRAGAFRPSRAAQSS